MAKLSEEILKGLSQKKKLILKPSENLLESIFSLIVKKDSERDFSKNLILFPGKRPKFFLIKLFSEKIKGAFIPPTILSMEEFINFCFEKVYPHRLLEPLEAVSLIYTLLLKEFKTYPIPLDHFLPLGFKILKVLEELYIEKIPWEKVKEIESFSLLSLLAFLYKEFYNFLEKKNLSTRAFRYQKVSTLNRKDLKEFEQIIWVGSFVLTNSEIEILKQLIQLENFYFLYQEVDRFNEKKITLYTAPDDWGQVKIAGEIINRWLQEGPLKESFLVVLPNWDKLFPLLRFGLPHLKEEEINISMGYPLKRTPIFGFFNQLFKVLLDIIEDKIYIPSYLDFLLHPYTKNTFFNNSAEKGRILIHKIKEVLESEEITFCPLKDLEKRITKNLKEFKDLEFSKEEIIKHLFFINSYTIYKFLEIDNLRSFFKKCRETLEFLKDFTTASYHPYFKPYFERFLEIFNKISSSEWVENISFEDRASYFNLFQNLISEEFYPFPGSPLKGLQILGFLETRNIPFERVIFLDLNEESFPQISEDYLLPSSIRKFLGLSTSEDQVKLQFYYFSLLLQGAKEVHLIYKSKGDFSVERSHFIEKILWEIEKERNKPLEEENKKYFLRNYNFILKEEKPGEIPKNEEILEIINNLSFSPSLLDCYLECSLKFYYQSILKLKKEETSKEIFSPKDIGTLVHKILKDYFSKRKDIILSEKDLEEDIGILVDEEFKRIYGEVIIGKIYLLKHQIQKRLREIINFYKNLSKSKKIKILALEEELKGELFNTPFKVVIDRIDREEGKIVIIDYKISNSSDKYKINFEALNLENKESWSKSIKSLQIPIYLLLYSQKEGVPLENLEGRYFLLGQIKLTEDSYFNPLGKVPNFSKALEKIKKVIESLLQEIKNPEIPFKPPFDFKLACRYCSFISICGTKGQVFTKSFP